MAFKINNLGLVSAINQSRRKLIQRVLAGSGLVLASAATLSPKTYAQDTENKEESARFPGDPADHKVVYQFNKSEEAYHKSVLFSVGAMLRKYGDNIQIVVVAIGPGIHILAKKPERPVSKETREKVSSLMQYGVEFHACGNTMKSLNWTEKEIIDSAKIVEVGAADLMELQEQGYSYISW